jgi:hypothetical protein
MSSSSRLLLGLLITAVVLPLPAELRFGAATTSITPDEPVALSGQRRVRISKVHETPIQVSALAMESREGDKVLGQAVIVSCDLVAIRDGIVDQVRMKVKPQVPDLDVDKVFLGATHTHTAPVMLDGRYTLPKEGVIQVSEYVDFMTTRIADAVVESWKNRKVGSFGFGQGQAVIAQNRRAVYANGSSVMYGKTDSENFRGLEGTEDHNLEVLFFWNGKDELIATAINVACPAQEVEGLSALNADLWHPVRETLKERYGKNLHILGLTGAGGDQVPRPMYGKSADARMLKLRGLTRLEEMSRRIVNGWTEAYEVAIKDKRSDGLLRHHVEIIKLPYRKVTETEKKTAQENANRYRPIPAQRWNYLWHQSVVSRYLIQQSEGVGTKDMELHVIRLGDVAIASNEFELFTDYGIQMKARSPAIQTFIIQLTGSAGYLPTVRAVDGGGYSAVIQSSLIGPIGGQKLVEETVAAMKSLWRK